MKISGAPIADTPGGGDLVVLLQGGKVKRIGYLAMLTAIADRLGPNAQFSATSASEVTIATGEHIFDVDAGKLFGPGQSVVIASQAEPGALMLARVTAHDPVSGLLTVEAASVIGAGTYDDWSISLTPSLDGAALFAAIADQITPLIASAVEDATDDIDASAITSGVLDAARIPILNSVKTIGTVDAVSDLDETQQGDIAIGTKVLLSDGRRLIYSGTGDKTLESSYIPFGDISPTIEAVEGLVAALAAKLAATGGTATDLTIEGGTLNNCAVSGAVSSAPFAVPDGAEVVLDPTNGINQYLTLGANRTATIANLTDERYIALEVTFGGCMLDITGVTWKTRDGLAPAPPSSGVGMILVKDCNGTPCAWKLWESA